MTKKELAEHRKNLNKYFDDNMSDDWFINTLALMMEHCEDKSKEGYVIADEEFDAYHFQRGKHTNSMFKKLFYMMWWFYEIENCNYRGYKYMIIKDFQSAILYKRDPYETDKEQKDYAWIHFKTDNGVHHPYSCWIFKNDKRYERYEWD